MASEHFVTAALFAVRLQDDFSQQGFLVADTRVFLKENGRLAWENPGRLQVFTDLSGSNFTTVIENKYYFPREVVVNVPSLNPRTPLVNVTMKPNYLYPFPSGSTLIRGQVVSSANGPIAGASVTLVGKPISNLTDPEGRFVIYFPPLAEEEITRQNNQRLVTIGASVTLQLTVTHPNFQSRTMAIGTVPEGETKLLGAPLVLDPI